MCIGEVVEQREQQIALVTNHMFRNLIWRCVREKPEERPTMETILNELESQNTQKSLKQ